MKDNTNTPPQAHFNTRTRLFVIEYNTSTGKSVIPTPRWVKDERTLHSWINERINDKSLPDWFENTIII